jgi:hypothetical protein
MPHWTHGSTFFAIADLHPHILAARDAESADSAFGLAAGTDAFSRAGNCNMSNGMFLWNWHFVGCCVDPPQCTVETKREK